MLYVFIVEFKLMGLIKKILNKLLFELVKL